MDVCHNIIVAFEIVEEETEESVYNFLRNTTSNKNRKAIIIDLKDEYRRPIDKLGFKHQFCKFHFKQAVNKYIRNHVKNNNLPEDKIE